MPYACCRHTLRYAAFAATMLTLVITLRHAAATIFATMLPLIRHLLRHVAVYIRRCCHADI